MVKLRRPPKSFKQMRAQAAGNRQTSNPNLAYRIKPEVPKGWGEPGVSRGYTTPEGAYMSPEYIDNLQTDKPVGQGKGKKGENCNRTACQAPGAYWYNHSTQAYYCRTCADLINRANRHDSFVRDLGHDLLTLDPDFADKAGGRR